MSLPIPEIGKRPRDEFTEALIQEALEEEQERKRQKKGGDAGTARKQQQQQKQQRKGQTLREIEEAEGGPVKESWVGMAAVQRALARKKAPVADDVDETDLPADITAYEEGDDDEDDNGMGAGGAGGGGRSAPRGGGQKGLSEAVAAAMEGHGGFAVTGFNMKQEREEGNIDEEGNFVPVRDEDDTAKDAWLNSEEAKQVSDKVKAAFVARQAAMAAAEEAPALSETAVAQAQREIATLLQPGESVTAALRRLGAARKPATASKAMGKREKQRLAAQKAAAAAAGGGGDTAASGGGSDDTAAAAAAESSFTRLTELADLLLNSGGEMDIYSHKKEQLERWAAAVLPQTDILADSGGVKGGGDDDDDDMFASDDGNDDGKAKGSKQGAAAAAAAPDTQAKQQQEPAAADAKPAAPAAAPAAPAAAAVEVDYSSWPVKELRRLLTERGVDSSSIVEKNELVAKVKQVAEQAAAAAVNPPPGYVYDPSSGYYYSSEAGLFWDKSSGGFFNSSDQKWYSYDAAAGQFVEWPQQQQQQH